MARSFRCAALAFYVIAILAGSLHAQNTDFHNAPESAKQLTNPYEGVPEAVKAGKPLYHLRCARCHGERGEGSGNVPALRSGLIRKVTSGGVSGS